MASLRNFIQLRIPSVAREFFVMAIGGVAENWRRFVLPAQSFPYLLFNLLGCDLDGFIAKCKEFKAAQLRCPQCIDCEFTAAILDFIRLDTTESASYSMQIVQQFLEDVACLSPISSDLVECQHGYSQHLLHRWRGCKPSDGVAQERVLWATISKSWSQFKKFMWDKFGDHHSGYRLYRFGKASSNQYSSRSSLVVQSDGEEEKFEAKPQETEKRGHARLSLEKMDCIMASQDTPQLPMTRKICGSFALLSLSCLFCLKSRLPFCTECCILHTAYSERYMMMI